MSFRGLVLTFDGRNEIVKAAMGEVFSITDVVFGDGKYNGSYNTVSSLVNHVMTIPITKVQRKENEVWIEVEYSSKDVPKAFFLREVGIIANGKLCYYDNAGADAEYMNPESSNIIQQRRMRFILLISQECQINVTVNSTLYALEDDLLKHSLNSDIHITPDERKSWNGMKEYTDERISKFISIGPDEPENTPVVWFKTVKTIGTEQLTKMLQLGDDADASAVAVKVDDVNYSVLNITEAKVENDNIVLTIT